ncbi:hypothetical protein RV02_GL000531 [Enterococcus gilvus]|nr:hypothetical protein RV02_GL000531 [Enterococcus gilvus]
MQLVESYAYENKSIFPDFGKMDSLQLVKSIQGVMNKKVRALSSAS